MAKKSIQIILFIGLVVILVSGAINRTQAMNPASNGYFQNGSHSGEENPAFNQNGGKGQHGGGGGKGRRNLPNSSETQGNLIIPGGADQVTWALPMIEQD